MEQNSGKLVKKGLFWSFADNILQQVVNFIVGIILARILSPEEFGILGIITIFIAISATFVDSGLSSALINKQDASDSDYNTVFWSNVLFGLLMYALLFFSSYAIADFFEEKSLVSLVRIASLSLVFVAFSSIQRTLYMKLINFRIITIVSIISVVISGITAIYMALEGYGVLSLVVRIVLGQCITLLLFWTLSKWRPRFEFNKESFLRMYRYGVNLQMSKMINTLSNNLYYFIIGKFFSPAILGYYTRANTFKDLASNNISTSVDRVSFASLSKITDRRARLEQFRKFLFVTMWIASLFMCILFICAKPIVLILIGEKWATSIIYLKILALSGILLPIYSLNINLLAIGQKTKKYLTIEILSKFLVVPIVIAGVYYGIEVMLKCIVLHSVVIYIMSVVSLRKYESIGYKKQLMPSIKLIGIFTLCTLGLLYLNSLFGFENLYLELVVNGFLIVGIFLILSRLLLKRESEFIWVYLKNFKWS
jgi:O-antigen/teichoic acid export membrane protein